MPLDTAHRTPHRAVSLDGLIVVDKPVGWTSHDVVAKLRRLTGERRIGHAGTLDPTATGVLPLGIGQGTRVIEYLLDDDKAYRATVRLGSTTDTDDAEGTVVRTGDWRSVTEEQVRAALGVFVGTIAQVPPAYSAIKRGGVPLHRLARAGEAVRPEPRRVTIYRIDVLAIALPDVTFEVVCSKGTYVRSLARDLGEALGCGGHLATLRRLRAGPFTLADAHTLGEIEDATASGGLPALLLPLDRPLLHTPALILDRRQESLLLTGRPLRHVGAPATPPRGSTADVAARRARAYGDDGAFVAVARHDGTAWVPEKVFADPRAS